MTFGWLIRRMRRASRLTLCGGSSVEGLIDLIARVLCGLKEVPSKHL